MNKEKNNKSVLKRAANIAYFIFFLLIGIILIANICIIAKGGTKKDSLFGKVPLIVTSGSMENDDVEPNIRIGDLIIVDETDVDKLKVGDIIAFKEDSNIISHRIVRLEEQDGQTVFITKGDNKINSEDKNPVRKENVVGLYSTKFDGVGNFVMTLQTPFGITCFVGLIVLIIIAYEIILMMFRPENKEHQSKAA